MHFRQNYTEIHRINLCFNNVAFCEDIVYNLSKFIIRIIFLLCVLHERDALQPCVINNPKTKYREDTAS